MHCHALGQGPGLSSRQPYASAKLPSTKKLIASYNQISPLAWGIMDLGNSQISAWKQFSRFFKGLCFLPLPNLEESLPAVTEVMSWPQGLLHPR